MSNTSSRLGLRRSDWTFISFWAISFSGALVADSFGLTDDQSSWILIISLFVGAILYAIAVSTTDKGLRGFFSTLGSGIVLLVIVGALLGAGTGLLMLVLGRFEEQIEAFLNHPASLAVVVGLVYSMILSLLILVVRGEKSAAKGQKTS